MVYEKAVLISLVKYYPVLIIVRDQFTWLDKLIKWLEEIGQERICLIDNRTTNPDCLDYLEQSDRTVLRMDRNYGHKVIWEAKILDKYKDERFILTDPDVLPTENCPSDIVERMDAVLNRNPDIKKCGPSLKIDDIHNQAAKEWEEQFWRVDKGDFYLAAIDTTFALYRKGSRYILGPGARLKPPYTFKHMPWYSEHPEDYIYYQNNIETYTHWTKEI